MGRIQRNPLNMKLYWHPLSPPSRAVYLGLKAMGCEFEDQVIDVPAGEHKTEAYLKINPAGQVPALVDDDLRLAESRAILVYSAQKTKSDLYPACPKARAKIDQALYWDMENLWSKIPAIVIPGLFKNDCDAMMEGLKAIVPAIEQLNSMISKEGWVCGAKCTLADISIQGTISGLLVLFKHGKDWRKELSIEDKSGIVAWHDNMKTVTGWKELFMEKVFPAYGIPVPE